MYNDNLLLNSIESEKEKLFSYKCNELLRYYSEETIINNISNPNFVSRAFTGSILSHDDINYSLIKKYYVSNYSTNSITADFNSCIEQLDFEEANKLLSTDPLLRQEVFKIYIKNIDVPNNYLVTYKTDYVGYDKINKTLVALNNFYLAKRVKNNIAQHKILKKSYKKQL